MVCVNVCVCVCTHFQYRISVFDSRQVQYTRSMLEMKSIVYTCTCIHSHTGTFIFYKLNVWSANADFSTFKHKYIHSYIYTCIHAQMHAHTYTYKHAQAQMHCRLALTGPQT